MKITDSGSLKEITEKPGLVSQVFLTSQMADSYSLGVAHVYNPNLLAQPVPVEYSLVFCAIRAVVLIASPLHSVSFAIIVSLRDFY